jgi:hypothetical protein
MKAFFKHPVALFGVDYKQGEHQIPDNHCAGWYFAALVSSGKITPILEEAADVEIDFAQEDPPKKKGRQAKKIEEPANEGT